MLRLLTHLIYIYLLKDQCQTSTHPKICCGCASIVDSVRLTICIFCLCLYFCVFKHFIKLESSMAYIPFTNIRLIKITCIQKHFLISITLLTFQLPISLLNSDLRNISCMLVTFETSHTLMS